MRSPTQRPAPFADGGATRRLRNAAPSAPACAARRSGGRGECAQRVEGVVGDRRRARPASTARRRSRPDIRRQPLRAAPRRTRRPDREVRRGSRASVGGNSVQRDGAGAAAPRWSDEVERQPAVAVAERLDAAPHDFARRGQRVEIGRVVAARRAPRGSRDSKIEAGIGAPCRLLDGVEQRVEARARPRRRPASS